MVRWDRLAGALLLMFAVYTMVTAVRLGMWMGRIPGPGFAPLWIGAGLALCGFLMLVRPVPAAAAHPPARTPAERAAGRGELVLAAQITLAAAVAMLLIPKVGMLAALALLLVALVRLLGASWSSAAATGVVVPLVLYLLFVRWLAVPIPKGPWGF